MTYYQWVRDSHCAEQAVRPVRPGVAISSGSNFRDGPANYYRAVSNKDPQSFFEMTALTFMGVRLGCPAATAIPRRNGPSTTTWEWPLVSPRWASRRLRNGRRRSSSSIRKEDFGTQDARKASSRSSWTERLWICRRKKTREFGSTSGSHRRKIRGSPGTPSTGFGIGCWGGESSMSPTICVPRTPRRIPSCWTSSRSSWSAPSTI